MTMVLLGRFPKVEGEELRLALLANGVEVEVRGDARAPLEGMLPAVDAGLELWVEDAALARAQAVQREVEEERRAAPTPVAPVSGRPSIFTALFAITTVVLAVLLWKERHASSAVEDGPLTWRVDPGSNCTSAYVKDRRLQRSCDRNGDGNWEQIDVYDRQGKLLSTSFDLDEDGIAEQVTTWDVGGRAVSRTVDLDHDWRPDQVEGFSLQDRVAGRTFDDDHDGREDRVLAFDETGALVSVTTRRDDDWEVVFRLDGGTVTQRVRDGRVELLIGDGGVVQVLTAEGCR
ncbi:MAG: hypothetical protein ACOZQL_06200 [Myxococcota bacterium]